MANTVELMITLPGVPPARVALGRTLTSIGSAADAQVRLAGVPAQWLLVHRDGERIAIAVLASGERIALGSGPIVIDGATIARATADVERAIPVGAIAEALAHADDPGRALAELLDHVIASAGADTGAIVLVEAGGHQIAAAREKGGRPVALRPGAMPARSLLALLDA